MLPRENRLPMRSPFKPTVQKRNDQFILKLTPNNISRNRFAIVVSKAVDKRAVVRNATKRVYRDCFLSLPPDKAGYDMLFIAKKPLLHLEKNEKRQFCQQVGAEIAFLTK